LAYSIDEALRLVPISRTKLYELMRAGTVETVRVGARRLIVAESLANLISGSGDDNAA
jgi:excisionase family DNA binding protein